MIARIGILFGHSQRLAGVLEQCDVESEQYSGSSTNAVYIAATSGTPVLSGNVFMAGCAPSGDIDVYLLDVGATFTSNRIVGSNCGSTTGSSVSMNEATSIIGTVSGNNIHGSRVMAFF